MWSSFEHFLPTGPTLNIARDGHSCALMTFFNQTSQRSEKILVAAGGYSTSSDDSVELLNLDQYEAQMATGWVPGPTLPVASYLSAMIQVEDGVVLVGGESSLGSSQSLYKLTSTGTHWEPLEVSLKEPRSRHVSFLLPDDLVHCHR